MTEEELKTIVGEVIAEIQRQGVEIDETVEAGSLADVFMVGTSGAAVVRVSPETVNAGEAELQEQLKGLDANAVKKIKINGSEKVPTDGVVDLGTITGGDGSVDEEIAAQVNENTTNIAQNTIDIEKLMKKNFPLTVSFSISPSALQEYGTTVNTVTANWSIDGADVEVLGVELQLGSAGEWIDVTGETSHTFSNAGITKNTTVNFSADISGEDVVNKSASINFAYAAYMGVVDEDFVINESNITALTKQLLSTSKSRNYTTSSALNLQRIVYAYAQTYGAISEVLDGNGFDVTDSFEQKTTTIDGVPYYVYLSKEATTTNTIVTVKFS